MKFHRSAIFISVLAVIFFGCFFLLKKNAEILREEDHAKIEMIPEAGVEAGAAPIPPEVSSESLNPQERNQLQVFAEILKSKNDNDPRMDQMLKNLSEPLKAALRKQYDEMKMEARNERGTIAFLIGRELKEGRGSLADVEFLKKVLMEKPCLSLLDCSKPSNSQNPEEQHLEGISETTAHYPQLMDLRYLKQSLESGNLSAEMKAAVIAALEAARNSPHPRVVQESQSILNSITH